MKISKLPSLFGNLSAHLIEIPESPDPESPFRNFNRISKPPKTLWALCKPEALDLLWKLPDYGLTVVGTRNPLQKSMDHVKQVIGDLKETKLIILSGFAVGIDRQAHLSAIHSNLRTIAVLGTGFDITYPADSFSIKLAIYHSGGILLSEFPPGSPPQKYTFLKRNRTLATLSKAVWLVQAPVHSGALNTLNWAREIGIECFATPCFPGESRMEGNQNTLDRNGAHLLWSAHSFTTQWPEVLFQKKLHRILSPGFATIEGLSEIQNQIAHQIEQKLLRCHSIDVIELSHELLQNGASVPDLMKTLKVLETTRKIFLDNSRIQSAITSQIDNPLRRDPNERYARLKDP